MSKESALAVASQAIASTQPSAPTTPLVASEAGAPPTQAQPQAEIPQEAPKSKAFEHLAKKEAELVRRQQEFKGKEESLRSQAAKIQEINDQYQKFLKDVQENPIEALKTLNFKEQDLFNWLAANQPKEQTPEEKAVAMAKEAAAWEVKQFKEEQQKQALELQQKQEAQAVDNYKQLLQGVLNSNQENLKYCAHYSTDAVDLAFKLAQEEYKLSGGKKILKPEEAFQIAEDWYQQEDQAKSHLRAKIEEKIEAEKPVEKKITPSPIGSRTVPNTGTTTVASTASMTKRSESSEEKRSRLIQALKQGRL